MTNEELKLKIIEIEEFLNRLKSQQLSYPLDDISAKIISDKLSGSITSSTKVSTSENQAVNEAGSSSYNVLKSPDAFIQVTVSGVTYYIPVFT